MTVVVQKYGGSSVADVSKLARVAEKVVATRHRGHRVVVVVSAMGKTTDELLKLAHEVDANPPRRELDMLLTTGERVSMALLSMAIQRLGCDAISFTGSQSGIITNDRHFDARIIEVRPFRVEDELERGKVVIVAGFQGMSYKREITCLGRGGTDTTAIAMAAALGAERAEIYSDVDGVYSADPRVVSDALHLPEIGYEQMQEMSLVGAKVLNADAVEFAKAKSIRIHARSTFGSSNETLVQEGVGSTRAAVVGRREVALIRCAGSPDDLRHTLQWLRQQSMDVFDSSQSGREAEFLVSGSMSQEQLDSLRRHESVVEARNDLGMLSVVSPEALKRPALSSDTLSVLEHLDVTPRSIRMTPLRISALLPAARLDDAVRAVHDKLAADHPS